MKHVEITELVSAVVVTMTKAEKLRHWAGLVRAWRGLAVLHLYDRLEDYRLSDLHHMRIMPGHGTAFEIACADPTLQAQGLGAPGNCTIVELMQFFELTPHQLHEFSCNCGGAISHDETAARIERLA